VWSETEGNILPWVYQHLDSHTHTHTHTHIYMYIYIYTCIHTYINSYVRLTEAIWPLKDLTYVSV